MGRITRAKAAEVADKLHVDEDAVLELPSDDLVKADSAPASNERTPLGEVSINSAGSKVDENLVEAKKASKSKRGGKKGRKGKKTNDNALDASTSSAPDVEQNEGVLLDNFESQPSPASTAASEDLMKDIPELDASHLPVHDIRPSTPPSNAVRLTRSQLREHAPELVPVEPKSLIEEKNVASRERQDTNTIQEKAPQPTIEIQPQSGFEIQEPALPSGSAVLDDPFTMPNYVQTTNGRTPAKSPAHWKVGNDAKSKDNEDMDSPMLRIISNEPSNGRTDSANGGSHSRSLSDFGCVGSDASNANMNPVRMFGAYDTLEKAVVDASTPPKSERVKIPVIPVADPTYDELEAAALTASTPPGTTTKPTSPSPTQDAITAMDAFDDEVEKFNAEVPEIQTSPEKPKTRKVTPVVRTTKASQARISLAHGPKDASKAPALGRPRQSSARHSIAHAQQFSQSTAKRVTSTSSAKSSQGANDGDVATERKEVEIPHSKPRPMSLQFPTPPPPPKSTKAPTKSTFQLPGEAIAAKLKAAKEARLQKEADDQAGKKTFKARPAPSFASKPPPAVRQTSTSKARESMMNGKPLVSSTSKRPHSVATTRPTTSKTTTASKPSPSARTGPKPGYSTKVGLTPRSGNVRPVSGVPSQGTKSLSVNKRPSTVMGTINKPRASLAPKPNPPATAQKGNGTAKGKEVFNRAAQAKSNAEKEKREKEEAAKKARAAAAERGRQASRDWAEKQRLKKLGLKPETKTAAVDVAATTTDLESMSEIQPVEEAIEEPVENAVDEAISIQA